MPESPPNGAQQPGTQQPGTQQGTLTPQQSAAAAAVSKGLVDINTRIGYDGAQGAGTGIVLSADGLVLTNHHVVAGATAIKATDAGNGQTYDATVLGYDSTVPVTMDDMLHHSKAVARGTERALIVTDLPFMSYQVSIEEAIRNAGRLQLLPGPRKPISRQDLVNWIVRDVLACRRRPAGVRLHVQCCLESRVYLGYCGFRRRWLQSFGVRRAATPAASP